MMMTITLLLAWLLTDLTATYGVIHYRRRLTPLAMARDFPRTVVIVAIKGVNDLTPRFLEALCDQHYPAYRLVLAVESPLDPVLLLIESLRSTLTAKRSLDVIIAGVATDRAQKVHNLLAALRTLRDEDRIVVFADADILPDPEWLSQLTRPVAIGEVAASTGYRWQLPIDRHWPSLIVAAADLSFATAARSWRWNVCWGGSTAVDRSALDQIDIQSVWEHAASDDLTLTAALRAKGLKINAPVHVLVPSPIAHTWASLFRFARRQYLLIRVYAPRHWLFAGWTLCIPVLASAVAMKQAIDGRWWGIAVILGSVALLELRMGVRRQIAGLLLPPAAQDMATDTIDFGCWAWPLVHLVHAAAFLASCAGHRFTWAGIPYRIKGRNVSVECRADTT
jgi:cellulose synthase/poly-beta-1,6-N-acetylglucosamine synthase-like glycosyltransferase